MMSWSRVSVLVIFLILGTEISVRSMAMSPELLVAVSFAWASKDRDRMGGREGMSKVRGRGGG